MSSRATFSGSPFTGLSGRTHPILFHQGCDKSDRLLGSVFLITGITTVMLGILPDSLIVLMVFLQPIVAVCFFPPGFAALSSIGPPRNRNLAISLAIPVAFLLGGGAIPTGIGMMGDAGSFALGISLVGGLILTGVILSRYLRFDR